MAVNLKFYSVDSLGNKKELTGSASFGNIYKGNQSIMGLAVYMNYPLDGETKVIYDESLLSGFESEQLTLIGNTWGISDDITVDSIMNAQNDYVLNKVSEENILWRQADLYARNYGARGSDEYIEAYNKRILFLQEKHDYEKNKTGKITWAFYTDRDGMVVVPSLYGENSNVSMELDFASIVPTKNGKYLSDMSVEQLQEMLQSLDLEYVPSESEDKNTLIQKIVKFKKYDLSSYSQCSPSNICEWLDSDSIDYDYSEPSSCNISLNGYYNKRKLKTSEDPVIKIVGKGWHTITLYSDSNDKFLVFGLQFMDINEYKKLLQ